MISFRHLDLYPPGVYPGWFGGTVRDAKAHGFEVIAAVVRETGAIVVTGLHPFRGRFVAHFTAEGGVDGDARVVSYEGSWTIAPDLRDPDAKKAAKRRPAGIGVEKLTRTDGKMSVAALRAWLKKGEADAE